MLYIFFIKSWLVFFIVPNLLFNGESLRYNTSANCHDDILFPLENNNNNRQPDNGIEKSVLFQKKEWVYVLDTGNRKEHEKRIYNANGKNASKNIVPSKFRNISDVCDNHDTYPFKTNVEKNLLCEFGKRLRTFVLELNVEHDTTIDR